MRKAYLFIAAVFAFVILDLCRLVQHGLRNASRTAPLDHFTQYDDSSSRAGVSV